MHLIKREKNFRDRFDPLTLTDNELINRFRFPLSELFQLIEEVEPALWRRTGRGHAVLPSAQMLMALRVLPSGSFQH